MTFRHLVWDLGGTLVDTYPQVDALFVAEVRRTGATVSVSEVSQLTRHSTSHAMTVLAERFAVTPQGLTAAYAELKRRWLTSPPPVMAGAHQLLAAVRERGGLNLVVTHRDRRSAEDLLRTLNLVVDDLICAPDGYRRKPDPQMYELMVRRHGLSTGECLAVGDRGIDAAGAKAAGMTTVLLTTPGIPLPAGTAGDHRVDSLAEVLPWVTG